MKILKNLLEDCKHLLFIDFEGTQMSHEVIAIGALICDCDSSYIPSNEYKTFKCYVKANAPIGYIIETMTGITQSKLDDEGLTFEDAMLKLNLFIANKTDKLKVVTYGNQDVRMLMTTLSKVNNPSPFLKEFCNFLAKNTLDFGTFISKYIRGKKNEFISLIHLRDFLKIAPSGTSHDPLVDSMDLYNIFKTITSHKEILIEAYTSLLVNSNLVPASIKNLIVDLVNGKTVSPEDFKLALEIYFS